MPTFNRVVLTGHYLVRMNDGHSVECCRCHKHMKKGDTCISKNTTHGKVDRFFCRPCYSKLWF